VANAQDQAVALLVGRRRLLERGVLARVAPRAGETFAQALVREGLLDKRAVNDVLLELVATAFACQSCGEWRGFADLDEQPTLTCMACLQPLVPLDDVPSSRRRPSEVGDVRGCLAEGRRLGPYLLDRELGRGSYGVVFRARREGLARPFALKVLTADRADEEAIQRFRQEAAIASRLDDAGVVGVYDVGREGDLDYYAMEYVEGPDLRALIAAGPVEPRRAAELVAQLARTIDEAHRQNVVHRDLKPSNVILDERLGRPRITDFGLARDRLMVDRMTRTGDVIGTPYYMAPEQIEGDLDADRRIDIYALGVILYECLCGKRPFEGGDFVALARKIVHGVPTPLRRRRPGVPEDLAAVVAQAMARRREDRYLTALGLADDLERFLAGEPTRARLDRSAGTGGRPAARGRAAGLVAAVALVGAAAGVGLWAWKGSPTGGGDEPAGGAPASTPAASAPTVDPAAARARARELIADGAPRDEVLAAFAEAEGALAGAPHQRAAVALERAAWELRHGYAAEALAAVQTLPVSEGALAGRALLLEGRAAERLDRRDVAQRAYERLRSRDPTGPTGLTAEAALLRLLERDEEALAAARRAVEADPGYVPALLELARDLILAERDFVAAERRLEEAAALAPDEPRAYLGLAQVLTENDPSEVVIALDRAVALTEPDPDPRVLLLRARAAADENRLEDALADLDRLLEREPDHAGGRFLRGVCLWTQAKRDGDAARRAAAVGELERALRLDRDATRRRLGEIVDPRRRRAILGALGLGPPPLLEVEPALRDRLRERAGRAGPDAAGPLFEALLRAAEGRPWSDLEEPFGRAVEAAPDSQVVAAERARVLVGRDVYHEALRELDRARRLGVDVDLLERLKGDVWRRRGKAYRAVRIYEDLARRSPDSLDGLVARARAALARSLDGPAEEAIERALEGDPAFVPAILAAGGLIDPEELGPDEAAARIDALVERIVAEEGYVNGHTVELRLTRTIVRVARDGELDPDSPYLPQAFRELERAFAVSDGAGSRFMAVNLALMVQKRSMVRRARRWLREARALEPDRGEVYMHLGLVDLLTGRGREQILRSFRAAKDVEPRIQMPPDWYEVWRQRFDDTSELDALEIPLAPGAQ